MDERTSVCMHLFLFLCRGAHASCAREDVVFMKLVLVVDIVVKLLHR